MFTIGKCLSKSWNWEWGMGNRERVSGNECSAVLSLKIQLCGWENSFAKWEARK